MLLTPQLSQIYGLKKVLCFSLIFSFIAQICLIYLVSNIYTSILLILMVGLTYSGKYLIGLNLILDYLPVSYHSSRILLFTLLDYSLSLFIISLVY
jgi:MFS family permease